MRLSSRYHRRFTAAARAVALLLLVGALLAPKVSLALAATLGNGYSSVVICTGSGLVRVAVSPDGAIVDDESDAWVSAHCVLPDERTSELQRAWQRTGFPEFAVAALINDVPDMDSSPRLLGAISNRGPPAGS